MRVSRFLIGVAILAIPAAALAQAARIMPGQWDIASTVTSVDMPGAPPQIARMMAGQTTRISRCVTPEDAGRGPQDLIETRKSCTFPRYSMIGGKFDSQMICSEGGGTMTATSSGTFTPTDFTSTARAVMTGASTMTVVSKSVGKRVGECKK